MKGRLGAVLKLMQSNYARLSLSLFIVAVTVSSFVYAQSIKLPAGGRFILSVSVGKELLQQCSRSRPDQNSQLGQPSSKEIEELNRRARYLSRAA